MSHSPIENVNIISNDILVKGSPFTHKLSCINCLLDNGNNGDSDFLLAI